MMEAINVTELLNHCKRCVWFKTMAYCSDCAVGPDGTPTNFTEVK